MEAFSDTQAIFEQLARTDGAGGVKTIIENHDAWAHNADVDACVDAAIRTRLARMPRDPVRDARIEKQRQSLSTLITRLKSRISSAG